MIQFLRIRIWVVGRIRKKRPWEFQGVFWTKKRAIAACEDETYFIGPATLNEILPRDTRVWPGAYYPKAKVSAGVHVTHVPKPIGEEQSGNKSDNQ